MRYCKTRGSILRALSLDYQNVRDLTKTLKKIEETVNFFNEKPNFR